MKKLLITGSRLWDDEDTIRYWLTNFQNRFPGEDLTIVSGNCLSGADEICERIGKELGYAIEQHPAAWNTDGKAAGFIRNRYMVLNAGVTHCLAFIRADSKGASHCRDFARQHGIPTKTIYYAENY